jgi:transcriptional regulator with XRE-family HTH domain
MLMDSSAIKAAIEAAGTSQSAIAEYLGVSTSSVARVVAGKGRSARVEAELAKILGRLPFGPPGKRGRKKTIWEGRVVAPQSEAA